MNQKQAYTPRRVTFINVSILLTLIIHNIAGWRHRNLPASTKGKCILAEGNLVQLTTTCREKYEPRLNAVRYFLKYSPHKVSTRCLWQHSPRWRPVWSQRRAPRYLKVMLFSNGYFYILHGGNIPRLQYSIVNLFFPPQTNLMKTHFRFSSCLWRTL